MTIGEKIRKIRKQQHISMGKLAEMAGVSRATVCAIEHSRGCRYETVEWLLGAMGYEMRIVRKEKE